MKKLMILLAAAAGVGAYFMEQPIVAYNTLRFRPASMLGWKVVNDVFVNRLGTKKFAIEETDPNTVLKDGMAAEGNHLVYDVDGILVEKEDSIAYYLLDNVNWKGYLIGFVGMNIDEVLRIVKGIDFSR